MNFGFVLFIVVLLLALHNNTVTVIVTIIILTFSYLVELSLTYFWSLLDFFIIVTQLMMFKNDTGRTIGRTEKASYKDAYSDA